MGSFQTDPEFQAKLDWHHIERALALADGAHRVVDPPSTEPCLRDLDAPARGGGAG